MKRWLVWIVVLLILCAAALATAFWRPLVMELASSKLVTELVFYLKEKVVKNETNNIENEVMRIEFSGHLYDIPLRYAYGEAFEKRGYWPKVKPERVKVKGISLSALLPDMEAYSSENAEQWKVRGHGDRVEVYYAYAPKLDWFQRYRDSYLNGEENRYYKRMESQHGLIHFANRSGHTIYFPFNDKVELYISCNKKDNATVFPSCRVVSNHKYGTTLRYYYGLEKLSDWQNIDLKIKSLIDRFEQPLSSKQTAQEG
ncbi:MAG: hypothetical protein LBL48_07760 [Azoarcus sp.]|jgi:hypothetical protein|nr:hypothetical protein [Azoarcus sp.]